MRIMQIVTQLESGGAQRVARLIDQGLSAQWPVSTKFLYHRRDAFGYDVSDCLLPGHPGIWGLASVFKGIRSAVEQYSPDVVITHTHYANAVTALALRKTPPVIPVHHGPLQHYPSSARLLDTIARRAGLYAEEIAVSPVVGLRNVRLIPNPAPDARDSENPASAPSSLFRVASVGRLSSEKRQETLIRAIASDSGTIAHFFGEGGERPRLEDLISQLGIGERALLCGETTPESLLSYLLDFDVYVAASESEAMPMSVLEAASVGLPVIATDIPAHRWILGEAALYFPVGDWTTLGRHIALLREDSEQRRAMSLAGKAVAARFSVTKFHSEYAKIVESVYDNHS